MEWSGRDGKGQDMGKGKGKDKDAVKGLALAMKGMMTSAKGKDMKGAMEAMMSKGKGGKGEGGGWGDGGGDSWKGSGAGAGVKRPKPTWVNTNGVDYSEHKFGMYHEEPGVGIEGLKDAITRALEPFHGTEEALGNTDMEMLMNKICTTIFKTSDKHWKDDKRHKEWNGSAVRARMLLDCFTNKVMDILAKDFYSKSWFSEIYLSEAIALAAIRAFKVPGGCVFKRTVAPVVVTHVNDAIFRYREEDRIQNVMSEAIKAIGFIPTYEKKATKHLTASYDAAFVGAKYGAISGASSPELGHIQDFVNAWMHGFSDRGWESFENGLRSDAASEKIIGMTNLFHYVTDPEHSCIPHDLLSQLDQPPANAIRDFITRQAVTMFEKSEEKTED